MSAHTIRRLAVLTLGLAVLLPIGAATGAGDDLASSLEKAAGSTSQC